MLRKVRRPAQLERDSVAMALRSATGAASARDALVATVERALGGPDDAILRNIVRGVDFEGRSTKVVAAELHLSERHCFRRRAQALDAISAQIESVVRGRVRPSLDALSWYARGRKLSRRRTPDDLQAAIACFEEALRRAPTMAKAHCGIAESRLIEGEYQFTEPRAAFAAATSAVHRALDLEPHLGEAHAALADLQLFAHRDFDGAQREIEIALACDPNCIEARVFAVWHALARGDFAAAMEHVAEALERAPEAPDVITSFGAARTFEGRGDEAIQILAGVVETDPDYPAARYELARALACADRNADALAALAMFVTGARWPQVRALELRCRAREQGRASQTFVDVQGLPPYQRAVALAGMDRADEAIAALHDAVDTGDPWVVFLRTDPLLAPLRERFTYRTIAQSIHGEVA